MASSRRAAFRSFQTELQDIVSCITRSVLVAQGEVAGKPDRVVLTPLAEIRGRTPITVGIGHFVDMSYATDVAGRLHTAKYIYSVADQTGPVLAYHYHPSDTPDIVFPHLHVYRSGTVGNLPLGPMHLPTGMVTLAAFIRLLHREFDVPYLRNDADDILRSLEELPRG